MALNRRATIRRGKDRFGKESCRHCRDTIRIGTELKRKDCIGIDSQSIGDVLAKLRIDSF